MELWSFNLRDACSLKYSASHSSSSIHQMWWRFLKCKNTTGLLYHRVEWWVLCGWAFAPLAIGEEVRYFWKFGKNCGFPRHFGSPSVHTGNNVYCFEGQIWHGTVQYGSTLSCKFSPDWEGNSTRVSKYKMVKKIPSFLQFLPHIVECTVQCTNSVSPVLMPNLAQIDTMPLNLNIGQNYDFTFFDCSFQWFFA